MAGAGAGIIPCYAVTGCAAGFGEDTTGVVGATGFGLTCGMLNEGEGTSAVTWGLVGGCV